MRVAGPITIWVAPPPSNRLWYSFTQPPELDIRAEPEVRVCLRVLCVCADRLCMARMRPHNSWATASCATLPVQPACLPS